MPSSCQSPSPVNSPSTGSPESGASPLYRPSTNRWILASPRGQKSEVKVSVGPVPLGAPRQKPLHACLSVCLPLSLIVPMVARCPGSCLAPVSAPVFTWRFPCVSLSSDFPLLVKTPAAGLEPTLIQCGLIVTRLHLRKLYFQ